MTPTPDIAQLCADLRRLRAAATQGEWKAGGLGYIYRFDDGSNPIGEGKMADCVLASAAVNAIEPLVAEVERLTAERDEAIRAGGEVFLRACKQRAGLPDDGLVPPLFDWINAARATRAKLDRLVADVQQAIPMIPTLKGLGELSKNWNDDAEAEMADCITGLRDQLLGAIADAKPEAKP